MSDHYEVELGGKTYSVDYPTDELPRTGEPFTVPLEIVDKLSEFEPVGWYGDDDEIHYFEP